MPPTKRSYDGAEKERSAGNVAGSESPFIPMFQTFRDELDEHHDRRERIIKVSRDITATSKKMYVQPCSHHKNKLPSLMNSTVSSHYKGYSITWFSTPKIPTKLTCPQSTLPELPHHPQNRLRRPSTQRIYAQIVSTHRP